MEGKLRGLFEYNRFNGNARLNKLIEETDARYGAELSDNDLRFVNAAGDTAEISNELDSHLHQLNNRP